MFFGKKHKCENCSSTIKGEFSYCPYCGSDLVDKAGERKKYGLLGRNDSVNEMNLPINNDFGFLFKMLGPVFNKLVKEIEKEMQKGVDEMNKVDATRIPNGIKIRIGYPQKEQKKEQKKTEVKTITSEQIKKMTDLPRATAKSSIKRLNDKVIYELRTPGVDSTEDIFISKLEKGYEVKAIGSKKIYVNSLPVELPLKRLSLLKDKLLVEFNTEE